MSENAKSLADQWWDSMQAESRIGDGLAKAGLDDWESIGGDPYDNSIEIYGVADDVRLTAAQLEWLYLCGFSQVYVNHKDGWETHYGLGAKPSVKGWRRRYVSDPTATTTNVIAGPENNGYFEVSEFPDSFPKQWLENGYMRVVPDPLMPVTPTQEHTNER